MCKLLSDRDQYYTSCTLVHEHGVISDFRMFTLWELEFLFETDELNFWESGYFLLETVRKCMIGFLHESPQILEKFISTIDNDIHRRNLLDIYRSYVKGLKTLQL